MVSSWPGNDYGFFTVVAITGFGLGAHSISIFSLLFLGVDDFNPIAALSASIVVNSVLRP